MSDCIRVLAGKSDQPCGWCFQCLRRKEKEIHTWLVVLNSGHLDSDWFFGPCSHNTAERTKKKLNEFAGKSVAETIPLQSIKEIWVAARAMREIQEEAEAVPSSASQPWHGEY